MSDERQQYWPLTITGQDQGYMMELRATLAWELVHHFGAIAGEDGGEDSAGRARIRLATPDELVSRCFGIADAFVAMAEQRQELRSLAMSEEEACERAGALARVRSRAEYPTTDMPVVEISPEEREMRQRHAKERQELRLKQQPKVEK